MSPLESHTRAYIAASKDVCLAADHTIHGRYDESNAILEKYRDFMTGKKDLVMVMMYERGDLS